MVGSCMPGLSRKTELFESNVVESVLYSTDLHYSQRYLLKVHCLANRSACYRFLQIG